ncbi:MAG TPA: ATP-binding protein [Candidatus Paceibacterota bacterium]|nr:ATP-binding protein [Candidatus Paceibacterota bacterium]
MVKFPLIIDSKTEETGLRVHFALSRKTVIVIKAATLYATYIATAMLSRYLFVHGSAPALIWLPTGIAWAALILWGYGFWPVIMAASLTASFLSGHHSFGALIFACGYTLEAFVAAFILRKVKFDPALARFSDVMTLLVSALALTLVGPLIGTFGFSLVARQLPIAWNAWWLGELTSVIIITPFLLQWRSPPSQSTLKVAVEGAIAFAITIGMLIVATWTSSATWNGISPSYIAILGLLWIALRFRIRYITAAMFLTIAIAIAALIFARVPSLIPGQTISDRILSNETALVVFQFIFLALAAAMEERNKARASTARYTADLEVALEKIRSDDRAKTEFIAILAHELRNPLMPIISYLELIGRTGMRNRKAKEYIEIIDRNARNMSHIIDDLLDISRISQQKFILHKESLSFRDAVVHALDTVQPLLKEKNHHLTAVLPEHDIRMEADPVRVEQILVNLITNAARYTTPGGAIRLEAKGENGMAIFHINDSGVGIAPHMLESIFETFAQSGTHRDSGRGLGIGLSLAKKLTELHGGTIEARSEGIGSGSEFIVRLPIAMRRRAADRAPSGAAIRSSAPALSLRANDRRKKRKARDILIVDDNQSAAKGLGKLLEYSGYKVTIAYDGESALELIKKSSPEVIVLDIGLPGVSGYDVARIAKEDMRSTATLIALTGYGQEHDKAKAREAGFDYHLTKPVSFAEIENIIKTVPPTPAIA